MYSAWRWCAFGLLSLAACGDDTDPVGAGGQGGGGGEGGEGGIAQEGGGGSTPDTCDTIECEDGSFCHAGACHSCDAPVGTQHDLVLPMGDDEEDRYYFLHVPSSYSCDAPAPILVDFHGTAGGDRPEEAYQLDALTALAENVGAIVVRPRSRSSSRGGQEIFRWDQNPGDLDRNVVFTQNLVEALRSTYAIDETRIYAAGFSSGSNMTSQFLGPARGLFTGLAPIAGGVWSDPGIEPFEPGEAPRIYLGTGYRDYLYFSMRDLLGVLADNDVPDDSILVREYDTGHDLYPWHFPELWAFLDEGTRPVQAPVEAPWVAEVVPDAATMLTLTKRADGSIVATGAQSQVWVRDALGDWGDPTFVDTDTVLTGACADVSGAVYVVGESHFTASSPTLVWGTPRTVPEFFGQFFGSSYLNGIGCAGVSPLAAAGYWTGAKSTDGGTQWTGLATDVGGYSAQSSAVHVTDAGTIVAVGYYDYIGRGAAGADALQSRSHPGGSEWLNDVTSAPLGKLWVVGDHGTILASTDDGLTWNAQTSGTGEDLYAVAFASNGLDGVVVGRRGTVLMTGDGGLSWDDRSIGSDIFLGAAVFTSDTQVMVAGEGGLVATTDLDP